MASSKRWMHRMTRLKITDVNPHLICALCSGYLVDATTIIECLHSFCRACIVRYLESSKFCPICDVLVHKTRPHLNIRPDKTLQDMVYKLVPGLFKEEMKRRKEFYKAHPTAVTSSSMNEREERGEVEESERGYDQVHHHDHQRAEEEEKVSLCLQHCSTLPVDQDGVLILSNINTDDKDCDKRYLNCPAGFTMGGIKKFIRIKFDLGPNMNIEVFHMDETLKNEYTLMDVAYIYAWRRMEPLKLYYIVYDSLKQKIHLPKPERLPIYDDAPRYVGKKRGRKRKHPLEDSTPAVVPSTSAAIAAALGKDLEDVGPELTPAETATSASSTADSSSSDESDQSDSEEEVDVMTVPVPNNDVTNEEPPEKKTKNGVDAADGLIKRGNFEAVRSHLMNGDFERKGLGALGGSLGSALGGSLGGAPGRTPLSSREFVVKKKKVETTDIALDPMDDFDMDGPGIILFPSKSVAGSNTGNNKEKTVVANATAAVNGAASSKKVVKVNGFTPGAGANGLVSAAVGEKKKSVNKLIVPKDSQSSPAVNGSTKPELVRAHSKEHAYSRSTSKESQHKMNGKENSIKLNGKDHSLSKHRRDSSSTSPRAKVKESSHKSPKDPQHSSKPSSKEPTPPKGSQAKDSSPKTNSKDSSPGSDTGSSDKPLKIKIKCDTYVDKKGSVGERKSSLSPRSYVITSSTTPPDPGPVTPAGSIGRKPSTPGSDGGTTGSAGHKRSRSSSSDSSKSKDRRSGSLGRTSTGEATHHYITKLSPGTESGKSPPSQREPIKMTITKSQISPPLKIQISPPLKNPISPPLPLKSQLSPPLKMKISTLDSNQLQVKVIENKAESNSEVTGKGQTTDKVTNEDSEDKCKEVNNVNGSTSTDKSDSNEVKATKEDETPASKSPVQQLSPSAQVSPSQVSPPQGRPAQPAKKADKRKSLEDKVFQLHKAKQNEQLQLLNRSTSVNVTQTPSAVTTVSDGTVSTTDPYHFTDSETSRSNGNANAVKMETQTKIKIKKDMGTSPSGPGGVELPGSLAHKKPPLVTGQRLLKPQPQPGRKQGQPVGPPPFIPNTPNLARVLSQGKQSPAQKPDSTTGDHKLAPEQSLLLQQLQQKQLIMLQQQRISAALQQQQLTPQQQAVLQTQQAVLQQLQSPSSSTTAGNAPQLLRSLSLQHPKPSHPTHLPLSPHRAMHKLPTMAPTSPVGGDMGKPQAKRPRINSGGSSNKVSPTGAPRGNQAGKQGGVMVNGGMSHPGRPASVPPQFPPGPFVNGILGALQANQHTTLDGRPVHVGVPRPPAGAVRPPVSHAGTVLTPPAQGVRMAQPTNGLQSRYLNVFKDWCAQNPAAAHTSPPPPGHSPPAHMHSYPPSHANGLSPTPAHSTTPPIANGYDAPLELTTKKRTDSSSSDSKNNNTTPSEGGTILKVPNLMSLKT